jgi:hypothetical protein
MNKPPSPGAEALLLQQARGNLDSFQELRALYLARPIWLFAPFSAGSRAAKNL